MRDETLNSSSTISDKHDLQKEGFLMRQMNRFFEFLGKWITKHPWKIIIFCLILTIICAVKTVTTKKGSDLLAYAPSNARSRYEHNVYQEFFGHDGQGVMNYVLIQAKDNGTMIRVNELNETVKVLDNIGRNFKVFNTLLNKNQSFEEFCTGFCQLNEPVRQFYNGLVIQNAQLKSGIPLNQRIKLKYPLTTMFSQTFTIQASFFGVELFTANDLARLHANSTTVITNIKKSSLVVLQFRAERDKGWSENAVLKYEQEIANYYTNEYNSDYIDVLVISPSHVAQEVERNGLALQPLLGLGFIVMCAFTIFTTIISSVYVQQSTWQKILLALTSCIVPLMACVTAFGIAFFCGLRFSPIIAVTPFLVLAIGVDDSFLMTFKLHQLSKKRLSVEEKIVNVCVETGPSVCLSSITNILAFLVGSLTSTPEIQLFNIVNAIALTVDLIYSLTLYAAILTLYTSKELEKQPENNNKCWRTKIYNKISIFLDYYVKFLLNIWVSLAFLSILLLFWFISFNGALQMDVNLRSEKFFLKDSKLLKADNLKQNYVTPTFTSLIVIVNNPGNLTDLKRVEKLNKLVNNLEHLPNSIGKQSTKYFLRDYNEYVTAFMEDFSLQGFDASSAEDFLKWPEYTYYNGFLQFTDVNDTDNSSHKQLKKFFLTTGYSGDLLRDWSQRHNILNQWRRTTDKFPDFNATIYYEDALFLDLIDVLPSATWQSAVATLVCMAVVCYIFINDLFTVFLTSLSIFSICIGEFGLLYYCGITLDPISTAALIMTIGFSVDLPSHIGYHYYRTEFDPDQDQNIEERLKSTLKSVGYPVLQAGLSTVLCLSTLLLAPLYMGEVFVLCMAFCIGLSLLHGLLIIPILLGLKFRLMNWIKSCGKQQTVAPHKILIPIGEAKF